jgi:hypothetical protein
MNQGQRGLRARGDADDRVHGRFVRAFLHVTSQISPGNPGEDATVDRQVSLAIVDRSPSLPEAFGLVNMRTSFKFG